MTEEGDVERLFDDEGEGEDGRIKWADSEARRLLYEDVKNGDIDDTMAVKDVYVQRPEFAAYDFEKFSSRLKTIKSSINKLKARADDDERAFQQYVSNHPISLYDRHYPKYKNRLIPRGRFLIKERAHPNAQE